MLAVWVGGWGGKMPLKRGSVRVKALASKIPVLQL